MQGFSENPQNIDKLSFRLFGSEILMIQFKYQGNKTENIKKCCQYLEN